MKKSRDRRIAVLEIADSVWLRLFIPWSRWAACTKGLPTDAKVFRVVRDEFRGIWRVAVWSSSFEPVPEGCEPPVLPAVAFTTHTCDAPGPKELPSG